MISSGAARRYARALFSLAQEDGSVVEVRRQIDELADLLASNDELRYAIFRPLHPSKERRAVLDGVCARLSVSDTVRHFCAFLVDQRRVIEFETIRSAFAELADSAAGVERAEVVSATPLDEAQKDRLRRALSARTGRQIELTERVDPALLGGAVARVGGLVFDGSLRTQLEQLRGSLMRGN
ncbi:MAG: ATP synthase F1 subunit delta [Myxococcota bacterium]|nr:ATP synthase F1 subunit delta [Myxococcota bacterium]